MLMPMIIGTTFYELEAAIKLAEKMNDEADDDWTYEVIDLENGLAKVAAYDENDEFVSYLGE